MLWLAIVSLLLAGLVIVLGKAKKAFKNSYIYWAELVINRKYVCSNSNEIMAKVVRKQREINFKPNYLFYWMLYRYELAKK